MMPNETPLENLFLYIRDIFGTSTNCLDFEKEPGNEKKKEVNFWEVHGFNELAKKTKFKNLNEFEFILTSETDNTNGLFLRAKRINVPSEPQPAIDIKEWLIINRSNIFKPTLNCKNEIEEIIRFDESEKRKEDFKRYIKESETALFEIPIPESLQGWLTKTENKHDYIHERTLSIRFEQDDSRVSKFRRFESDFRNYYEQYESHLKVNHIYDGLHKLYYDIKGKDNVRLYFSFGLINGKIGNKAYRNFLFHVPLKLTLKNQELKIEFDTFSNKLFAEQNFIELLDEHFSQDSATSKEAKKTDVLKAIDKFNSQVLQFYFEKEFIRNIFYNSALEILNIFPKKEILFFSGEELNLSFDNKVKPQDICFSFSPIIQTKLTEANIEISKDADCIAKKIHELKQNDQLDLIPDFFKRLFATEILDEDTNTVEPTHSREKRSTEISESSKQIQYLFPLPYNDEQFEIAKRLYEQDAVTVKGPPGTGKSHTIANLISHFVSQGKSILVVSHNSKALSVIKDKLPADIQSLAISLVNEGHGKESLKASVNAIISNISDRRYNEKKIEEINTFLNGLQNWYNEALGKIYSLIQSNTKATELYNPFENRLETKSATEWAEYFFNKKFFAPSFIKDEIPYTYDTNKTGSEIIELIEIGKELNDNEVELFKYNFIDEHVFLALPEFRRIEERVNHILSEINPDDYNSIYHKAIDKEYFSAHQLFIERLKKLRSKQIAHKIVATEHYNYDQLIRLLNDNQTVLEQLQYADNTLLNYSVDISILENDNPFELQKQINQLLLKFGDNKSLNFFARKLLNRQLSKFFECKVNYASVNDVEQLKIVEIEITKRRLTEQLKITFRNYFKSNLLGDINNVHEDIAELTESVEFNKHLQSFNQILKSKNLPTLSLHSKEFDNNLLFLEKLPLYIEYEELKSILFEYSKKIKEHTKQHPLIEKLSNSIIALDRSSYEIYLKEYLRQKEKLSLSVRFQKIQSGLLKIIPQTTSQIVNVLRQKQTPHITTDVIEEDIFLLKLTNFLNSTLSEYGDSEKLFDELQTIKKNIERKTADLIVAKTWFYKASQVSGNELSALNAWLNDLIKVGAGFGKNANRDYASAIKNMQIAKKAVPIWIMPLESAISFFPDCSPNQFDVLIIDEASQCDISSLNLIFRSKKALIVGDENQTSVIVDRSISIAKTNDLLNKYLYSHQFKTQFDVTGRISSVYAMASVVYPNIVTLKEHFRCLPEIIGFSNQYIYANSIIPLKTATENIFGEPIEIRYIEDDISEIHKPKIVQSILSDILQIIQDYTDKKIATLPTIGIISLDSSNLNHIRELNKQILGNETIKLHSEEINFLAATSREFQGDERDIIYLTVTATHKFLEEGDMITIKPPTAVASEDFMRIYNVAASRAKEKSILYHSIHPDAIPIINPECYRKKIIDYYSNYRESNKLAKSNLLQDLLNRVDASSGDFEKGVCTFLYNNNYGNQINPQYKVGGYVIDFGIIMNNKKIAIECDGYTYHSGYEKIREDIKRQEILERAGWQFFRIQSTEWFYKNDQVCRKLLKWLNQYATEASSIS